MAITCRSSQCKKNVWPKWVNEASFTPRNRNIAGTAPLLLIGTPPEVFMLLLVAVIIQLLLQHSNVDYFVGTLRNILAINSMHRFHHLKTAKEGDVNFGLFTTFTDYVLGTA